MSSTPPPSTPAPTLPVADRFFGFSAVSFCGEIFKAVDDYICDGVDAMEIVLVPQFSGPDREQLKTANDSFIERVTQAFDRNMDKFEIYAHRNILSVPAPVEKILEAEVTATALTPGSAKKRRLSKAATPQAASPAGLGISVPETKDDVPTPA
ncbi:hypothetical protein TeGR_g13000, partial [Tetraparma gracilis]